MEQNGLEFNNDIQKKVNVLQPLLYFLPKDMLIKLIEIDTHSLQGSNCLFFLAFAQNFGYEQL